MNSFLDRGALGTFFVLPLPAAVLILACTNASANPPTSLAAPPPMSAEISITSDIDHADIELDGILVGQTPAIFPVSPHDAVIRVLKRGYGTYTTHVVLMSGGKQTVHALMLPLAGTALSSDTVDNWTELDRLWPLLGVWLFLTLIPAGALGVQFFRMFRSPAVKPATVPGAAKWDASQPLNEEWTQWTQEVAIRRAILDGLTGQLDPSAASHLEIERHERKRRIAATDLFVEKAQATLLSQAKVLSRSAVYCTFVGIVTLLVGAVMLYVMPQPPDSLAVPAMIVRVLRGAAIGGFIIGAAGFPIYLAKAMFHEAVQLGNRRHALRFGRLYLYLTGGDIRNFDHLERAFQWSGEFSTGFKDIRHDLPRGVLGDATKLVQSVAEATKNAKEQQSVT